MCSFPLLKPAAKEWQFVLDNWIDFTRSCFVLTEGVNFNVKVFFELFCRGKVYIPNSLIGYLIHVSLQEPRAFHLCACYLPIDSCLAFSMYIMALVTCKHDSASPAFQPEQWAEIIAPSVSVIKFSLAITALHDFSRPCHTLKALESCCYTSLFLLPQFLGINRHQIPNKAQRTWGLHFHIISHIHISII